MPESAYVSSLVQGDINSLRSYVCGLIDDFYKNYDPRKSIDMTFITGLIAEVHLSLDELKATLNTHYTLFKDKEKKK